MEGDWATAGKVALSVVNASSLFIGVTTLVFVKKSSIGGSVNAFYLQSLAASDIVQACGVVPVSLAALCAADGGGGWSLLPDGARLAQSTLFNVTWLATLLSLTWLNIDHYVFSRRPAKPDGSRSAAAAAFWVVVIWGSSVAFSVPPLLLRQAPFSCSSAFVFCFVNWRLFYAYLAASALIVVAPPAVALLFTTFYVVSPNFGRRLAVVGVSRVTMYHTNSLAVLATLLSWALMLIAVGIHDSHPVVAFAAFWTGMASPLWRFVVYCFFARSVISPSLAARRCEEKRV